jgi:hypothetical protein
MCSNPAAIGPDQGADNVEVGVARIPVPVNDVGLGTESEALEVRICDLEQGVRGKPLRRVEA